MSLYESESCSNDCFNCIIVYISRLKHETFASNYRKPNISGTTNSSSSVSVHAEEKAIKKLKPSKGKTHKLVSIVVLKFSRTFMISESQPCIKCMSIMANLLPKKGYKLEYIYHSNSERQIICTTLNNLIEKNSFFVSMLLNKTLERKGINNDPTKLKNVKKMIKMFTIKGDKKKT